jgi:hypothetical protein
MSMWDLGNAFTAAAHDVYQRYQELAASGGGLQGDKQARFVADNGPAGLFRGWETTLDGLLLQTLRMVEQVGHGWRAPATVVVVRLLLCCMQAVRAPY